MSVVELEQLFFASGVASDLREVAAAVVKRRTARISTSLSTVLARVIAVAASLTVEQHTAGVSR